MLWTMRATSNVQEFGRKIFLKEHVNCTADVCFMSVFEDGNNEPLRMNVTAFSTWRGTLRELGCYPCTHTVPVSLSLPAQMVFVHNQMKFRPEYLYKLEKLSQEMILYSLNYDVAHRDGISATLAVSIRPGFYKSWSLKFDEMEWRPSEFGRVICVGILIPVMFTCMATKQRNGPDCGEVQIKRSCTYFRTVCRLSKFRRVCHICAKSLFPTNMTTALGVHDRVFLNEFGDQSQSMVKWNGQYLSEIEVWKTG
ncbi:hypothetical protein IW261DRAFT_1424013 [Armillaria novae-zelandiae]|uniref:Uncharacterized protein n=1 Tax=Armillaria novae-zelandiae TaxID=153914 RepID=A0AA39UBQ8_9AGAR|nr:hypothetical protein IW261DRAFT_1424013 [Armillaria novae-zelandiae]